MLILFFICYICIATSLLIMRRDINIYQNHLARKAYKIYRRNLFSKEKEDYDEKLHAV